LIDFDQLALVAVSSEPARPLKINLDRAPRKMASPPQLDDRPFAVITKSHIHAILDVQIRPDAQALGKLIKRSWPVKPAADGPWEARLWITTESG
jgi:hypothetical protein